MEKLSNLPKPVLAGAAVGGGGSLIAAGVAIGSGNWWIFLIVFVLVIAVVLGGFLILAAWRRKKKSAQMGGQIQQHNSAVRGISDPGQRARLDDLRKKFEQGVNEYRSRGKDLYTLPWYMIVGEPGSGKTEAIRHSNVGFPPGMQDEFQGVGGTINMNWWFTNYAVLLDTAGRLMFEEIRPGETSEWKEFLGLLKRNRPNCPVNGLLLVIPSDSLIKDSAEDIARKAGRIAQQLDVIQRVLDVRFPVFVIVSKCDKVNGFREFFDGLNDPQQQHQIMGWSNPSPLDQPFRPELLDQHLEQVVQRLCRRRLGLLRDPVPELASARRIDEVDALYALPHSLSLLAPRLRRYLETIFLAGEWSAKPLFLRGIYFTSSMREGAALDEELANVMGVPVDQLGEGKVWERERAYFLRDLFVEKVFREKGLVTRAANTSQMLRRNKLILFCGGTAGLALFIIIAVFSMVSLRNNVEDHSKYWHAVAAVGWQNHTWKQPLVPFKAGGAYADAVTNQVVVERPIELARFHASLRDLAEKQLPRNWFYPGLSSLYARKSRSAQRVVFDTGIVKPLVEAARQKMTRDLSNDPEALRRFPEALAALIRLEMDADPGAPGSKKPLTLQATEGFLRPLWSFVAGQDAASDPAFTNLVGVMLRTYTGGEAGSSWAPPWLSGAVASTNLLGNNPPMRANLDALENVVKASAKVRVDRWNETLKLRDSLAEFKRAEEALFAAAKAGDDSKFDQQFALLARARAEADAQLQQPKVKETLAFGGGISLSNAYSKFSDQLRGVAADVVRTVRAPLSQSGHPLYTEIGQRLDLIQQQAEVRMASLNPSGDAARWREMDAFLLAKPGGYAERGAVYAEIMKQLTATPFASLKQLSRLKPSPLETYQKETLGPLAARAREYAGSFKPEFGVISTAALARVERAQRLAFLNAYKQEVEALVRGSAGFPLIKATNSFIGLQNLPKLRRDLTYVGNDLKEPILQGAPFQDHADWKRFSSWVANLNQVSQALLDDDGNPLKCTISLRKKEGAGAAMDDWSLGYHDIKLEGAKDRMRSDTGQDVALGAIAMDAPAVLQLFRNVDDNQGRSYPSPAWGALWLIHQYAKPSVAGTVWVLDRPSELQADNFKDPLRLRLEFPKPLPSLESWPGPTP